MSIAGQLLTNPINVSLVVGVIALAAAALVGLQLRAKQLARLVPVKVRKQQP